MFDKLIPWKREHQETGNRLSVRQNDDPIATLRRDFDNLLGRFWEEGGLSRRHASRWLATSVDFDENDREYVMTAELPGFEAGDIDVKVSGHVLTVKAEHKEDTDDDRGKMHHYGSFYESFTLPAGVNADAIVASYHSGVLKIQAPKDESAPAKRIDVKVA